MKRKVLFFLFAASAVLLLASCGGSHEQTARTRAESYIRGKYGFSADVTNVVLSENGWLEFSFEAPSMANVRMSHDGREFDVIVPVRDNSAGRYADNYEQDAVCADIEKYVRDTLVCEKLEMRIDYGVNYGRNMLPKDVRSADDLAGSGCDTTISVFTYGLEPDSVSRLDPVRYGKNTRFGIADMLDPALPDPEYGTMRELPENGGWKVGGIFYTDNGGWTQNVYKSTVIDNVCLVMPEACGITFKKTEAAGDPGDEPVTDWYSISGTGEGYGKLYVSVGDRSAEYCIEYIGKDGRAYYERIPHIDGGSAEYELCTQRYCSGVAGKETVLRIVKRDFYGEYAE